VNATPLDEPDPNDVDELNDRESSYIPWYRDIDYDDDDADRLGSDESR
jgi:hypothetical protein